MDASIIVAVIQICEKLRAHYIPRVDDILVTRDYLASTIGRTEETVGNWAKDAGLTIYKPGKGDEHFISLKEWGEKICD